MSVAGVMWLVVIVLGIVVFLRLTRRQDPDEPRPHGFGSAAAGSVYGWLNEDKQKALEIVVEGRAAAHDPEDADGNLPDLEEPKKV